MKKSCLLFLTFSIVFFSIYGQSDIGKEIISDLIAEEFSPVPDETGLNGNEQEKKLKDKKESCIIILSESQTQIIDTRVDSLERFQRIGLVSLDLYTMNDYFKKNQNSIKISEFYLDQIKIKYMTQKEWDGIMEQGGWKLYHTLHGYNPKIKLSRPGINESMDKAFIYYDVISDKMGGAGFYLILEKVNNKWIVKEKIIAWMS